MHRVAATRPSYHMENQLPAYVGGGSLFLSDVSGVERRRQTELISPCWNCMRQDKSLKSELPSLFMTLVSKQVRDLDEGKGYQWAGDLDLNWLRAANRISIIAGFLSSFILLFPPFFLSHSSQSTHHTRILSTIQNWLRRPPLCNYAASSNPSCYISLLGFSRLG